MAQRENEARMKQLAANSERGLSAATNMMAAAAYIPAQLARHNMTFVQKRVQAYSEFMKLTASSEQPGDFAQAYTRFGQKFMSDYVGYYQGVTRTLMGIADDAHLRRAFEELKEVRLRPEN